MSDGGSIASGAPIAGLLEKWRTVESTLPPNAPFGLRMRRATSWLDRASREGDDPDAMFICCWIAFNAAYANEGEEKEWILFDGYFYRILNLGSGWKINKAIWRQFRTPINEFVGNRFVYWRFWDHQAGKDGASDWDSRLNRDVRRVRDALAKQLTHETKDVLAILFSRLYVLRNQLLHGGATWNSSVNRQQVRDGAALMFFLVPIFVDVMLDNPGEDWGTPRFPVVRE